jgi:hypothetical protein
MLLSGGILDDKVSVHSSGFGFGLAISNILINLMLKNKNIEEIKKGI